MTVVLENEGILLNDYIFKVKCYYVLSRYITLFLLSLLWRNRGTVTLSDKFQYWSDDFESAERNEVPSRAIRGTELTKPGRSNTLRVLFEIFLL
jgi:hypothetical protein